MALVGSSVIVTLNVAYNLIRRHDAESLMLHVELQITFYKVSRLTITYFIACMWLQFDWLYLRGANAFDSIDFIETKGDLMNYLKFTIRTL